MQLKVLLPFEVFADEAEVLRIVAETPQGSFGLLPHRLDCGEVCLAVDRGVLVKSGPQVLVSVRRALRGKDLGALRGAVAKQFMTEDAQEQSLRQAMARLESGFLHRFAGFERA
jgi:F-type H+-transporting ATPase subunit epsilon